MKKAIKYIENQTKGLIEYNDGCKVDLKRKDLSKSFCSMLKEEIQDNKELITSLKKVIKHLKTV